MSPVPDNVLDKQLYQSIKEDIHQKLKLKGTRWGIYDSSELVRRYKEKGGRYDSRYGKTKKQGVSRWYKQVWINICESEPPQKMVPCGRKNPYSGPYPVCRPYYKISQKTPTTYNELTNDEIKKACKNKNKNPQKILSTFSK